MAMVEMQVEGIGIDGHNNPLVMLRNAARTRFIPIWIGAAEALSIQMGLENRIAPRPLTADLTKNIMGALDMSLMQVTINDFVNAVFYARLHLQIGEDKDSIQEMDARPSDGIALALRAGCPILVDEIVLEKVGVPMRDERKDDSPEKERFERLLEDVDLGDSEKN